MGGGIAMSFANAGIPVTVLEARADALERGVSTIRGNYEASARKGKLSAADVQERLRLIRPTLELRELAGADVVVEAVFEQLKVKEEVFRRLDAVMRPGAILATNTSTLDVDRIARFTARPEDVVGTHFFSPANVMRLLEVVRGARTGKDVLASVLALGRRLGKVSVVSGVCFGFIGNRMIEQYHRQAIAMLEEGALPQQIDGALERWGMAMGVFRMSDLAGNDVGWLIRKDRLAGDPEHARLWTLADRLCERGRLGQKAGRGWYRYEPGRRDPLPDPEVEALIVARSAELGVARRELTDEEIVQRCVLALVNEGARLLQEGIALRASDVDLVYLMGYGFPAHRGGPMFHADTLGLERVLGLMREFATRPCGLAAEAWSPAPLLVERARAGRALTA
jgi:3-hydroxyacyl-CoA dehydrogenase